MAMEAPTVHVQNAVSRLITNSSSPDCVVVRDCNKLVGLLMLSALAVVALLAACFRLIQSAAARLSLNARGYRKSSKVETALAELAEMDASESPRSSQPNSPREGHLEQVQPNLLETLVLSRRASKEGPPSRAAPQSPPPSPPEPETPSSIAPATTPSSPGTSAAVATPSSPTASAANNEEAAGGVARQKTFVQKIRELGYAPRDLYLIYSIKFAESTAYFAFSYIYAPYLSMEFGMSDIDAGILYALYGVLCSVFGLLAGPVIDSLPLRSALLLGTVPSFIARFGSALTIDVDFVAFCSISALPLGAAFGLPVFALGVRRFTHPENRAFAFTIFYAVLCASSAAGGFVISFARAYFQDGLYLPWPVDLKLSWMRVNVLLCSAFTLYTVAASCMIRNVRVEQNVPLEHAKLESLGGERQVGSRSWAERKRVAKNYMTTVYGDAAFWRLLVISLIVALGTRATFRHLDATFPKYFMRTFGKNAPFEIFVAVEPVITVLLSFPVTFLLLRQRASTYRTLVGGTLLQSFCPLALIWSSYGNTLAFVVIMALGEAIWSPRLYEYSTMVAPEGCARLL